MRPAVYPALVALLLTAACSAPSTSASSSGAPTLSASAGAPSVSPVAPSAAASSGGAAAGPCTVFPADNVWHADVSKLPVHKDSVAWVASIGVTAHAHPDFGAGLIDGAPFGIPVTTVGAGQPGVAVTFQYAGESDRGPYPVPRDARVEGGAHATGDRHVIVEDTAACKSYELFAATRNADGNWKAGSGAVFDLRRNDLRKAGWTSADAAGLSILAGLARYDEVTAGNIDHAIRFTAPKTRKVYVWPARHAASEATDTALPPMGARFRLKPTVDVSKFPPQAKAIARALQRYGAILSDNGSPWYFSGTQDDRWANQQLDALKALKGSDFEAVDASLLMLDPDSARCRPLGG